ncbi:hypothetical protein DUNSADRAFT_14050 [Dunaliella salina]|uniref:Uncharacterized protein n=1 Tax=Dunaliella salina TaxID=3046 RepID=A0ABQ7G856_DUNSA|nr:hypothetical protein DUNSADRAFT_14050 [Dunaliella salina]|eukprot:KAF5830784.1 hypothetical protein DUNSADRAFT_14050 [Dunaliella salina]
MTLGDGGGVNSCAEADEGSEQQNRVQQPKQRKENGKDPSFVAHSGSSRPTQGGSDSSSSEDDNPWEDKIARTWRKLQHNLKNPSAPGGQQPPRLRRGPSVREARGTRYYLRKEVDELSDLIGKLETAVMNAHSFREHSSSLLEEAHRARGRLELAIQAQQHQELIVVASEMKACVRRGLTLVHVYGEFSMAWKVVTQLFRSAAYEKFGKARSWKEGHDSKVLKEGRHDRVLSAAFVPLQASSHNLPPICLWWSTNNMLEFWTEAGGSTTGFRIGKDSQVVTAISIDSDGNGLVRVRQKMQWDLVLSDKAFNQPIKCIAFDERQGNAWVGDEGGHVKCQGNAFVSDEEGRVEVRVAAGLCVHAHALIRQENEELRHRLRESNESGGSKSAKATPGWAMRGPCQGSPKKGTAPAAGDATDGDEVAHTQLDVIATLQPTLMDKITVGFLNQCFGCGKVQAAKQAVCDKPPDRPTEGPIRCIHLQDDKAWISGGISNSQPWLSLPFMPPPRTSLETQTPRQSQGGAQAPAGLQWRLLTGHENGQLLLWNPHANRLSPLIMIGPPGSPIR